jgi:glycosyltransferase involved in cell wall biosynthesis
VELPAASVVVCTRGRPVLLDGCLQALGAQDHPSFEIIVVDNAPADDRVRDVVARYPGVRYEVEPTPGLDVARNRGVACARAGVIAFTDDDARPEPDWLTRIVEQFSSFPELASVTGKVEAAELDTVSQRLFEMAYRGMSKGPVPRHHRRRGVMRYLPAVFGTGCNMAFRRDALVAIGGFDPALDAGTASGGGGDLDALQRLFEAGRTIGYAPGVVVQHVHRRTMTELRSQLYDNGRGYSAAMTAALLRARPLDRVSVALWWMLWLGWWFGRRIVLRLVGLHELPLPLIFAELAGALAGPVLYVRERRVAPPALLLAV